MTDDLGLVSGKDDVVFPTYFIACAEGKGESIYRAAARPAGDVTLVLTDEAAVCGRVVDTNGDPVPDMTLIAWPGQVPLTCSAASMRSLRSARPGFPVTHTDSAGRFCFRHLVSSDKYAILGGCRGGFVLRSRPLVVAPAADVELIAAREYAALVHVVEPTGLELTTDGSNGEYFSFQIDPAEGRAVNWNAADRIQACIAGLDAAWFDSAGASQLVLACSDVPTRPRISATMNCVYPGYRPVQSSVECLPVGSTGAPIEVSLVATAGGFGSLAVTFVPPPDTTFTAWPVGTLHLHDGTGTAVDLFLDGRSREFQWDHVPFGAYSWRFAGKPGAFTYPPVNEGEQLVDVSPTTGTIMLPLNNATSVRFDVVRSDGSDYDQFLSLEVYETNDGFRGAPGDSLRNPAYFRFEGPPYAACILHPGTYAIRCRWPALDSNVHLSTYDVLLSNGAPSMQHTLVVR